MNTGYHILDATGLDLDDLGTVSGLNAKCKAALALGKAVIMEGVVNDGAPITSIPVALMADGTSVNIYAPTGNLTVSAADVVSVLEAASKTVKKK